MNMHSLYPSFSSSRVSECGGRGDTCPAKFSSVCAIFGFLNMKLHLFFFVFFRVFVHFCVLNCYGSNFVHANKIAFRQFGL